MDEVQLTSEETFQIELSSVKNNSYSVEFNLNNYIEIKANLTKNIIRTSYCSKYSFEEIRENKYFLQFDTLNEIFDELKDRIYNNKIIAEEKENNLIINIPLPTSKNKEIIFELKPIVENSNVRFNELTELIMKLNTEINETKEEVLNLKKEMKQIKDENIQLKNEINDMNNKENEIKNKNELLIKEVNQLKNDNTDLKNDNALIKIKIFNWKMNLIN